MNFLARDPVKRFEVRKPCPRCPFRKDIQPFITRERAHEIQASIYKGAPFWCHETVDYERWDTDEDGNEVHYIAGSTESVCAGSMMVADREDRLDDFDDIRNCGVEVFDSFSEWARAQEQRIEQDDDADFCSVVDAGCEAPAGYGFASGVVDGDEMTSSKCPDCFEYVCPSCLDHDDVADETVCSGCLRWRKKDRDCK